MQLIVILFKSDEDPLRSRKQDGTGTNNATLLPQPPSNQTSYNIESKLFKTMSEGKIFVVFNILLLAIHSQKGIRHIFHICTDVMR